jgi:hypothetical protein
MPIGVFVIALTGLIWMASEANPYSSPWARTICDAVGGTCDRPSWIAIAAASGCLICLVEHWIRQRQ